MQNRSGRQDGGAGWGVGVGSGRGANQMLKGQMLGVHVMFFISTPVFTGLAATEATYPETWTLSTVSC